MPEQKQRNSNELHDQYRALFLSGRYGPLVLKDLLRRLHVFEKHLDSEAKVVLRNFGMELMLILSGGKPGAEDIPVDYHIEAIQRHYKTTKEEKK